MFIGTITGFLGSDAKETQRGCSFNVSTKQYEDGKEKTLWVSCFINFPTKITPYLTKGTRVCVIGEATVTTFKHPTTEESSLSVTINVIKVDIQSKKDKENGSE